MTKADLVERIYSASGMNMKESKAVLESVFSLLKDTLESGEQIKIAGFGNFEVRHKSNRKGRNPLTGEAITIEARRILTFKPSKILKEDINR